MAYRFRLDFLLRLYAAWEQREEGKFAALSRQSAEAEQRVRACDESRRELGDGQRTALLEGVTAADLHFRQMCVKTLETRRLSLAQAAESLRREWAAQRERMLAARRRREALEVLRRSEAEVYAREMSRREQSAVDEMFLMRRRPGRD